MKYTKKYAKELCESNPNKNNLYGLSSLLDKYQVDNEGLLLDRSKLSLSKIDPPFVVEMKEGFGIVLEKDAEKINLLISKKKKTISCDEFVKNWSGVVLISEINEKSGKPNYSENRKASLLSIFEKCLFGTSLILFLLFCGIENGLFSECGLVFSLWLLFVNNLVFGLIKMPNFKGWDLISVLCIYLIPLFFVYLLLPVFMKFSKLTKVSRRFNQLKSDEDIFRSLLKSSR